MLQLRRVWTLGAALQGLNRCTALRCARVHLLTVALDALGALCEHLLCVESFIAKLDAFVLSSLQICHKSSVFRLAIETTTIHGPSTESDLMHAAHATKRKHTNYSYAHAPVGRAHKCPKAHNHAESNSSKETITVQVPSGLGQTTIGLRQARKAAGVLAQEKTRS